MRRAVEKKCRYDGKNAKPGRLTAPPGDGPIPMNISVAETGLCGSLKKKKRMKLEVSTRWGRGVGIIMI